MTERQLLWRVELPLAVPEIIAGVRIATVSTVAIATLAVFAGAGGLGAEIYSAITQDVFKTGIVVRDGDPARWRDARSPSTCMLVWRAARWRSPWRRAGRCDDRVLDPQVAPARCLPRLVLGRLRLHLQPSRGR